MKGTLKGDGEETVKTQRRSLKQKKAKKIKLDEDGFAKEDEKEDIQLDRAVEYLKSWHSYKGIMKEAG